MTIERVTISGLYFGQTIQNVLHFNNQDGAMTPLQVAQELRDWYMLQIRFNQVSGMVWNQIKVQTLPTSSGPPTNLTVAIAGNTVTSFGYPSVLSVIWSFRTNLAGRRGRGRIYVPAPQDGTFLNNVLNASYQANWQAAANIVKGWYGEGGTRTPRLVVGPKNYTSIADYYTVTNIQIRPFIGIQRRRNQGVGI